MFKKSTARIVLAAFVPMLFLSVNTFASKCFTPEKVRKTQTSRTNCSRTTDADLVKTIKEKLEADAKIQSQMTHVNVSVKNKTVRLEGWLNGGVLVARAISITKQTKCVRKVTSNLRTRGGGSCGPGQQACGDICIDKKSQCNITIGNN